MTHWAGVITRVLVGGRLEGGSQKKSEMEAEFRVMPGGAHELAGGL